MDFILSVLAKYICFQFLKEKKKNIIINKENRNTK